MPTSQNASGLSFLNWWYQPFTEWQKTFMNFMHLEQKVAPEQTVDVSQKDLINVSIFNGFNKEDQSLEQEIHSKLGSDGLQIAKIRKALYVVVSHLEMTDLTLAEQTAINDFATFCDNVSQIVAQKRGFRATNPVPGYRVSPASPLWKKRNARALVAQEQLSSMLKPQTNGHKKPVPTQPGRSKRHKKAPAPR